MKCELTEIENIEEQFGKACPYYARVFAPKGLGKNEAYPCYEGCGFIEGSHIGDPDYEADLKILKAKAD